jgi:urease accessory protein
MLRLHSIVGHESDPALHARLHALEHRDGIELLFVPSDETGRKRFRLATDRGTDCAVSLDRYAALADGAVLFLDEKRAIIARFGEQSVLRLKPANVAAALKLGWAAGNLHWRVRFDGERLIVLVDGAKSDYRARIADLLDEGAVEECADV